MEKTLKEIFGLLPKRPIDSHKGTFGKVLVIAGSINYPGAARLVCEACYRVGAGVVTLASIPKVCEITSNKISEVTFIHLIDEEGGIGTDSFYSLKEEIPEYAVLIIGPGLGQNTQTLNFIKMLFQFLSQ